MFKARRDWISDRLKVTPFLSLEELVLQFPDVSEMTLRRDIDFLVERGEAKKVRGGCKSTHFIDESEETDHPYFSRMTENLDAKIAIAKEAVKLLDVGRSIFLDSGSTVKETVQFIPNERYTFTTTSPQTALELCRIGQPIVNLVGGRLDKDYQAVTGMQAMSFLDGINIDIAVLCASGFSVKNGFTGGNYNECELKKFVLQKASTVIMLLDVSKADRSLPYTFAALDSVDYLICDAPLPEEITDAAKVSGTKVIISQKN